MTLHLDFETRGVVDLPKQGVYRYASDKYTQVSCASYCFGDGPVMRWRPGMPYPFAGYDGPIYAFNAPFERLIWEFVCANDHGWPTLEIERFRCVAAMARVNALPGSLDKLARALRLKQQKDMDGHRLMMKLCKPKEILADGTPTWHEDPEDMARQEDYCDDDVRTEVAAFNCLRDLTDEEWRYFWDNEHINDRGMGVDVTFARQARRYAKLEFDMLGKRVAEITHNQVTTTKQYARMKDWLTPRLSEDAVDVTMHYVKGEKKQKFDKATRHNLLAMDDESPGFLDWDVREFVETVDLAGRAATAKYNAMLIRQIDERVNGAYMYAGAGQTQRYSSKGAQLHNFVRDTVTIKDDNGDKVSIAEEVIQAFISKDESRIRNYGHPIDLLSKSLRPTIVPKDAEFLAWCDWSAVEGRGLPWLAIGKNIKRHAQRSAQEKLDKFAAGIDLYVETATSIGIDDPAGAGRQIGKVAELSLGFMGAKGAFLAMARGYGVVLAEDKIGRIVSAWREANPFADALATELERAAMSAIHVPGRQFDAGKLSYVFTEGSHNGLNTLWCRLPSGDVIAYPDARIERMLMPWGKMADQITALKGNWHPKQGAKQWPRFKVWKGLLSENVTQATCASLQKRALTASLDAGLDVVGHTHDEILIETDDPATDGGQLQTIMETGFDWSAGLPLNAEMEYGLRYKVKA